jgi:hypothetical protein
MKLASSETVLGKRARRDCKGWLNIDQALHIACPIRQVQRVHGTLANRRLL